MKVFLIIPCSTVRYLSHLPVTQKLNVIMLALPPRQKNIQLSEQILQKGSKEEIK